LEVGRSIGLYLVMRVSTTRHAPGVALAYASLVALACRAEDAAPAAAADRVPAAHYEPPSAGASTIFLETFQGDWASRWTKSLKEVYSGDFEHAPYAIEAIPGDVGLSMPTKARRYGLSRALDSPAALSEQPLVMQYEVSLKNGLECGGAYVKLLNVDASFDLSQFEEPTPYSIMFGPDKCGGTGKVHFIFKFKNPVSGKWVEHHLTGGPALPPTSSHPTVLTHLYRFALLGDNKLRVTIDDAEPVDLSLLEHFEPPVIPPKEIDDPTDVKPEDWVDEPMMDDPDARKPDDWDEDAPFQIPDPDAVKPADWHDDEPFEIPDPQASMPTDWDEEEDGEWEAPLVANPKCSNPGCGEWRAPMVSNPEYKGKWYPPRVENPAYKGEWKARQIPNPEHFEDAAPWKSLAPIGAVGFELWTMDDGVLFDNVLITRSEEEAKEFAAKTWGVRHAAETAARDTAMKAEEAAAAGDWKERAVRALNRALDFVADNPVPVAITIAAGFAALLLLCCWPSGRAEQLPTPPPAPSGAAASAGEAAPGAQAGASSSTAAAGSDGVDKAEKRATRRTPKAAD